MALDVSFGNDDDPALLFRLQHIISGAIRYGRPRYAHVVKIDNWFGKRWLCFAGTPGGEELRSETRLAVPPFAPNRVVAETTYRRRRDELSRIEARPLHAQPPSRDPVYLDERVHSGVFVWYSGQTSGRDRGALMVYDVERGGEQRAWYAELQQRGGTWTISSAVGTSVSELEELETSYANRLAPLSMHPADREYEEDRRLWQEAMAATYGSSLAKAAVLIQKYKARYPDNPGIRLLHARNLGERRLLEMAEAEFRASERYDAAGERWRVIWLQEWADFCELRRDDGRAEQARRELVTLEPNHTAQWILLGGCLARRGKLDEALEVHRHATGLRGDRDEAFLNVGLVLRAMGRFDEAADALRRALVLCPEYPEASEALQDVQEALRLASGDEV